MTDLPEHASRAVRAAVLLHERELRSFLSTWRTAQAAKVTLPGTDDAAYASREALLRHVFSAARHYVVWVRDQVGLSKPELAPPPKVDELEAGAERYLDALLAMWATALAELTDAQLEPQTYTASWGTPYSLDAMLEHAVMHPMRHRFQLEELLAD